MILRTEVMSSVVQTNSSLQAAGVPESARLAEKESVGIATRKLIMTTVHRIKSDALSPFFRSLHRTGFTGDIVVFAGTVDEPSIREFESWGARVVRFTFRSIDVGNRLARPWWLWKRLFASGLSSATKERLVHAVFHLFYRRHLLYLEYLREHGDDYDHVFVTDCRDVYFQRDPFSWSPPPGLHVFLEEETNKIGKCPHNAPWIESQFGSETLHAMAGDTVSCAGTVFGDVCGMMEYLGKMVSTAMQVDSLRAADGDQGIHNFLIRQQCLNAVSIHPNRRGPVMTLGAMRFDDLRFNRAGWVLNEAGEVIPTLHQYDRLPELRDMLSSRL